MVNIIDFLNYYDILLIGDFMEGFANYQEAILDLEEYNSTILDLFKEKKEVDKRLLNAYKKTFDFCKRIEGINAPDYIRFIKSVILDKINTNKILVHKRDFMDCIDIYDIRFCVFDPVTKIVNEYGCEFNGQYGEFVNGVFEAADPVQLLSKRLERTTFVKMNTKEGESCECPEIEETFYLACQQLCQKRFEDEQKGNLKPMSYYFNSPEIF